MNVESTLVNFESDIAITVDLEDLHARTRIKCEMQETLYFMVRDKALQNVLRISTSFKKKQFFT